MVVITGLGRCGSSILTKYLKLLNFGLGKNINWHKQVNAGYELSTFYTLVHDLYHRYCKLGIPINLDDEAWGDYWKGHTYRQALENVDKDERQGRIDLVKDPRITWNPKIIESIWEVRKDIKLLICHRKVESIYNSRKSLPVQYDDPKPRLKLDEYKTDFSDFFTKVLELEIPYRILYFPNFLKNHGTLYHNIATWLPHNYERGKEVFDEIIERKFLK